MQSALSKRLKLATDGIHPKNRFFTFYSRLTKRHLKNYRVFEPNRGEDRRWERAAGGDSARGDWTSFRKGAGVNVVRVHGPMPEVLRHHT